MLDSYVESNKVMQDWVRHAVKMTVVDGDFFGTGRNYQKGWAGRDYAA
jgi:hypothetical protein